jgi:hypothetical protein
MRIGALLVATVAVGCIAVFGHTNGLPEQRKAGCRQLAELLGLARRDVK